MNAIEKTAWVPLKFEPADLMLKAEIRGNSVDVMMSPYDVPEAIRGYYSESTGRFVFELKYISNEEDRLDLNGPDVTCSVGKFSGRLYSFSIDRNSEILQLKDVPPFKWAEMAHELREIVELKTLHQSPENFRLVRKAIDLVAA